MHLLFRFWFCFVVVCCGSRLSTWPCTWISFQFSPFEFVLDLFDKTLHLHLALSVSDQRLLWWWMQWVLKNYVRHWLFMEVLLNNNRTLKPYPAARSPFNHSQPDIVHRHCISLLKTSSLVRLLSWSSSPMIILSVSFSTLFDHSLKAREPKYFLLTKKQGIRTTAKYVLEFRILTSDSSWNKPNLIVVFCPGFWQDVLRFGMVW